MKLSEGRRRTPSFFQKAATPPEVKLSEGSRRKRRTPFLREEAEGRKQVHQAEGRAFFKTSSLPSASFGFLRKAARGEASRRTFRKPLLREDARPSASSRRKGVLRFLRKAGDVEGSAVGLRLSERSASTLGLPQPLGGSQGLLMECSFDHRPWVCRLYMMISIGPAL